MALIHCPECASQISSKATACPRCGAPVLSAPDVRDTGVPITTVEETSKRFKLHIIIASFMFWGGLLFTASQIGNVQKAEDINMGANVVASFATVIGLVWYVVTKFRIWWHHK